MKYGVFAILVMIIFATFAQAEESEGPRLNPNDMAIYLLDDTIFQAKFARQPFTSFKTDAWYLKFLECVNKVEYGVQKKAWLPEPGTPPRKKSLVTRFQLFDKPIYLTFTLSQ